MSHFKFEWSLSFLGSYTKLHVFVNSLALAFLLLLRMKKFCSGLHCPLHFDLFHKRDINILFAVSLAQSTTNVTKAMVVTPHLNKYNSEGFVVFNEKGEVGKLCTENLNNSILQNKSTEILHTVSASLCKSLTYGYGIAKQKFMHSK